MVRTVPSAGSWRRPNRSSSDTDPLKARSTRPAAYGGDVPGEDATPQFPLRDLVGFHVEQGEGEAWATVDIDELHINPHGTVHGAVMFMMLDTVMGAATLTAIPSGNWCSTVDIHIRYFAPAFGGGLRAHAKVRRAGKRIVHLDGEVIGDDGTEYCAASGVFAVIPSRA